MPFDSAPRTSATWSTTPLAGTTAPGRPEHADEPGARVGRAADHLQRLAVTRVDRQHLQLVGIGVARGGEHPRDAEALQLLGRVLDAFDLEADGVELRRDLRRRRLGRDVLLEPGLQDFHRSILSPYAGVPTPADKLGMSNAENP